MSNDNLVHDIAAMAQKVDLLDELKYRDYCIREEFNMKYEQRHLLNLTVELIEVLLAEKYSLSTATIHEIVYKKKKVGNFPLVSRQKPTKQSKNKEK